MGTRATYALTAAPRIGEGALVRTAGRRGGLAARLGGSFERGALAITQLNRRGTCLVRYLVGDIVSLTHEPCPHCGRTGDRIVPPIVRTKDLLKVKGMLINPTVLLESLTAVPNVDEFQVVLTRQDVMQALLTFVVIFMKP